MNVMKVLFSGLVAVALSACGSSNAIDGTWKGSTTVDTFPVAETLVFDSNGTINVTAVTTLPGSCVLTAVLTGKFTTATSGSTDTLTTTLTSGTVSDVPAGCSTEAGTTGSAPASATDLSEFTGASTYTISGSTLTITGTSGALSGSVQTLTKS